MAREARGLRQQDVVDALGVSQVTVSRWETGSRELSHDELPRLAELYGVTPDFFTLDERDAGLVAGDLHHRRRRGVRVGDVRQLEAETNILRIGASRLLDEVEVDFPLDIPSLAADRFSPAQAATETRRYWNMPIGPVANLTSLLESAGVIVVHGDFEMGLDGVSMWAGPFPVMHLSRHAPADRLRFTMAHELGHLVLHQESYDDSRGEREANEFAAEFLMPADQIRPRLKGLDLRKALTLKLEWWVAVSALIVRAKDVQAITSEQATRLHKQRSARGWTKHEPYGEVFPPELPTTLERVQDTLRSNGLDDDDISRLLCRPRPGAQPSTERGNLRLIQ